VSLPKLEPSRKSVSSMVMHTYQIALKQRNENPQNNMTASFSFASTGKFNSIVTSTGRDLDSTIKFDASTGEERFPRGTDVAFDISVIIIIINNKSIYIALILSIAKRFTMQKKIWLKSKSLKIITYICT